MSFNIGAAIAGGNGKRREHDFYPTPWEATVALLDAVDLPERIWEPACGDGAMVDVLRAYGHTVVATDIALETETQVSGVPSRCDFLTTGYSPFWNNYAIVTNPPFKHAAAFIDKALTFTPIVAMLLKSQFWNAAKRLDLWRRHPPSQVLPLTWRLDFTDGGAPTMDCTWFVWGVEPHVFRPLPKPSGDKHPVLQ